MAAYKKIKMEDAVFESVNTLYLLLCFAIVAYPLLYIVSASFSSPTDIVSGSIRLLPKNFNAAAYERVFRDESILTGYMNTILYTVVGTAVNICMTVMAAYPLSRKDFLGRNMITLMIIFTMYFSGGLIPGYLVVKGLGMINTMWALIIPSALSAWNFIIMRTYFQKSIPPELIEAATLDGCSNIKVLYNVVLPLSKPIIAVLVLFYGVGHWNAYFSALLYLSDAGKYPLQLVIRQILLLSQMNEMMETVTDSSLQQILLSEGIKYAVIVVANAPVLAVYPFLQKYFVKGIMLGGLKG